MLTINITDRGEAYLNDVYQDEQEGREYAALVMEEACPDAHEGCEPCLYSEAAALIERGTNDVEVDGFHVTLTLA